MAQHLPKQGKLESGGLDDDLHDEDQRSAVLVMVLCFCSSCSASPALLDLPTCHRHRLRVCIPNVFIHPILASPGERDSAEH